jgi:hypothetical protein
MAPIANSSGEKTSEKKSLVAGCQMSHSPRRNVTKAFALHEVHIYQFEIGFLSLSMNADDDYEIAQ